MALRTGDAVLKDILAELRRMNHLLDRRVRDGPGGPLMSAEDVSDYLGIPVGTLYQWRSRTDETGPPAYRVGRWLRYRRCDVDAWLESLPRVD